MKMYIAVLDQVPQHMVPVLVAHSVLNAHQKFLNEKDYQIWLSNSFKKVVLSVNEKEFKNISNLQLVHLGYENTVLGGTPSCAVVCPREGIPNVLKFAKMWK